MASRGRKFIDMKVIIIMMICVMMTWTNSRVTGQQVVNSSFNDVSRVNNTSNQFQPSQVLATTTSNSNASSDNAQDYPTNSVPSLNIKITTPLSILGAFLIVSGAPMAFWGGRNRWSSYFLTGAYLAALIVMIPILKFGIIEQDHRPTRVVEGVFVLICLISAIGAGAVGVIFWKGTRFLVGAAGGFVISLFVLSLKSNSLIPAIGLRWVVILAGVSLGFILATIPALAIYVTLFATAATGAAAAVLGIDCFTTGGLKEFWLYIVGFGGLFPKVTYFPFTVIIQAELGLMAGLFLMSAAVQWRLLEYIKKKIDELRQLDVERGLQEDAAAYRQTMALDADLTPWEKRHGDEAESVTMTMVASPTNPHHSRKNSQFSLAPTTSGAPRVAYHDVPYHPNEHLPMIDGGVDLGNSLDIVEEFSDPTLKREEPKVETLDPSQVGTNPSSNLQKNNSVVSSINFDQTVTDRRFSRPPGAPSSWTSPVTITKLNAQKPVSYSGSNLDEPRPISYHSLYAQPEEASHPSSRPRGPSARLSRPISEHLTTGRAQDTRSRVESKRYSEVPPRVIIGSYEPPTTSSNLAPKRESKIMTVEELDQRHKQAMKNLQHTVADKTNNSADPKQSLPQSHRQSAQFKGQSSDRRTSTFESSRNHERRSSSDLLMGRNNQQQEAHTHSRTAQTSSKQPPLPPSSSQTRARMDSGKTSSGVKGWLDY